MEPKPLSAAVASRLEMSKNIYNLVLELHPEGTYQPDIRNTLFHALSDIVPEHFGAIIHLVEAKQFFGSAFALLRPLIETYLRAVWTGNIATDEELEAIAKHEGQFPPFTKCRSAVEGFFKEAGVPGLFAMDKSFINALHGFTHSGVEQLINRVDGTLHITPYEYPDHKVIALLDQAGRFAVMSAMGIVQAIEGDASTMAPKVETLQLRFNQIRRSFGADD